MRHQLLRFAAAAALAAGTVWAQAPQAATQPDTGATSQGADRGSRLRPREAARNLNLTRDQRQQMKAIFQQARQTAKPVRDQLQQNREALQAAVTSGKTDAEIQQLATQQGILRGQIIAVRSQAWAKFYSLLTPEQRAQVKPVRL